MLSRVLKITSAAAIAATVATAASANPMVGGARMYANRTIVQNALHSKDHTTLVAALKAAGLVKTLEGRGPYTVFAPTNEAFAKLPKGTVHALMAPKNHALLVKVLECNVMTGKATKELITKTAANFDGMVVLDMLGGCKLTAIARNGKLLIEDGRGDVATVTIPDVMQSNGIIHVVDTVMLPPN